MGPKKEVSRIAWDNLEPGKEIGQDSRYIVQEGWLKLTRRRVPVAYKVGRMYYTMRSDEFMEEAEILMGLHGIRNVPRLYGMTAGPPLAIVMSRCPGVPIKEFQSSETALTYFSAIRKAIFIVARVHRRDIAHCDVSDITILVEAKGNTEKVKVHLVGFDNAVFTKAAQTMKIDSLQLMDLVHVMAEKLDESSNFFEHRDKLLVEEELDMAGILRLLCGVLHGDPKTCRKCRFRRPV